MSENEESLFAKVLRLVEQAAAEAVDDELLVADPAEIQATARDIFAQCGVSLTALYEAVLAAAITLGARSLRAVEAIKDIEATLKQHLCCERVLSQPFVVGANGEAVRFIYTAPAGREAGGFNCVALPRDAEAPPLLSFVFTAEGKRCEGPAPAPPLTQEEYTVACAEEQSRLVPDLGELTLISGERRATRYVLPECAADIRQRLGRGEKVTVLCDRAIVSQILDSREVHDPFVEFLPAEGNTLRDVILPQSLHVELEKFADLLAQGVGWSLLLEGPTGTGKSMTADALARTAGLRAGKSVALYTIGAAWTGSEYVDRAPLNMRLVFQAAATTAQKGRVAVIHIPEIDGLVGARGHRYEGSHDRSVRTVLQELLSKPLPGVGIIATKNYTRDSFLPDTIERRFQPIEYKRPTRRQLAAVAAKYAAPWGRALEERLGMSAEDFGSALADSLSFVVARCHFYSGRMLPVRARDLTTACPAKMESLAVDFCRDLEAGSAESLFGLFARVAREFHAIDLNEQNVLDGATFLKREKYLANDSVKLVERVDAEDAVRAEALVCG